ncbi:MAG: glucokinase [Candidatus Methylumidiphilus sp.]
MRTGTLLLAGDIGGTKTKLALYESAGGELLRLRDQTYASSDYQDFHAIVADFISESPSVPAAACFGVAGPVAEGRCRTTNLPWLIEESAVAAHTGIPAVRLLNDLQAMALGLKDLPAHELVELNPDAQPRVGNMAVIAAGTGCGEAMLYWDGQTHHAIATEGGHADFAPNSREQEGLLRWLKIKYGGHVSYERILSGPGLYNIYQYLREEGMATESVEFHAALLAGGDPGRLISRFALEENNLLCRETIRMFVRVYGAEAGNLALKSLAHGGVLIGGGIAPKILPAMANGDFLAGFRAKGRFSEWMGSLSVKVALNQDAGLLGAAQCAARRGGLAA